MIFHRHKRTPTSWQNIKKALRDLKMIKLGHIDDVEIKNRAEKAIKILEEMKELFAADLENKHRPKFEVKNEVKKK